MRFNPKEAQQNLQPINILGNPDYAVNPYTDDFYKRVIELRQHTKRLMKEASNAEYETLDVKQAGLKTLANGTSYGIFLQLNVDNLSTKKIITCYGYNGKGYPFPVTSVEKRGQYYHPLIGTLITGAARLMFTVAPVCETDF
jgi:DNA polymerase elongation subunit (family B)